MKMVRNLLIAGVFLAVVFTVACSSPEEPTATPTSIPPTATQIPEPTATPSPTEPPVSVAPTATAIAEATAEAKALETAEAEEAAAAAMQAEEAAKKQAEKARLDPRSGGVFRLLGRDPTTLDPALTTDSTAYEIVVELFSGLMHLTDDPNEPIVLDLAESFTVSSDGTVYRFVLRERLEFSDGSPVTAFDFKWSWERAALPETGSPIVKEFLGDIVGINEIVEGEATSADGITVIDDHTLEVRIDAPKPYFIAKLTYPVTFVVNRDNVESGGETWTDDPVGTGPFVLDSYEIGVSMVIARNEKYWDRRAFLDEVQFKFGGWFRYGDVRERRDRYNWYPAICVRAGDRPSRTDL